LEWRDQSVGRAQADLCSSGHRPAVGHLCAEGRWGGPHLSAIRAVVPRPIGARTAKSRCTERRDALAVAARTAKRRRMFPGGGPGVHEALARARVGGVRRRRPRHLNTSRLVRERIARPSTELPVIVKRGVRSCRPPNSGRPRGLRAIQFTRAYPSGDAGGAARRHALEAARRIHNMRRLLQTKDLRADHTTAAAPRLGVLQSSVPRAGSTCRRCSAFSA
jgi:hypothetical protein